MTIEYAKAYSRERLARADRSRLMRHVIHNRRACHGASDSLARAWAGRRLIDIGERLLGVHDHPVNA